MDSKNRRIALNSQFQLICNNVYFQPPTGKMIKHPCILYHKTGIDDRRANNAFYGGETVYQITVITLDPDSTLPTEILEKFPRASMTNTFVNDGLYHTIYKLTD